MFVAVHSLSSPLSPASQLLSPLGLKHDEDTDTMRINTVDLNDIEMDLNELVEEVQNEVVDTPVPALPSIQSSRELKSIVAEHEKADHLRRFKVQNAVNNDGMHGHQPADDTSMGSIYGTVSVSTMKDSEHLELENVNSAESVRL